MVSSGPLTPLNGSRTSNVDFSMTSLRLIYHRLSKTNGYCDTLHIRMVHTRSLIFVRHLNNGLPGIRIYIFLTTKFLPDHLFLRANFCDLPPASSTTTYQAFHSPYYPTPYSAVPIVWSLRSWLSHEVAEGSSHPIP